MNWWHIKIQTVLRNWRLVTCSILESFIHVGYIEWLDGSNLGLILLYVVGFERNTTWQLSCWKMDSWWAWSTAPWNSTPSAAAASGTATTCWSSTATTGGSTPAAWKRESDSDRKNGVTCIHLVLTWCLYSRWDRYQIGNRTFEDMDVMEAYKTALTTWAHWVDTNVDPTKTRVFFQGISPVHYQ